MAETSREVTAKIRYFARNPVPGVLDSNGAYNMANTTGRADEVKTTTREQYKTARQKATEEVEVRVVDARAADGGLGAWSLDKNGFMLIEAPPPVDFQDKEAVKRIYFPQLAERAKQATGATHAIVTSHQMRTENPLNFTMNYARFSHADAAPGMVETWRQTLAKRGVPEQVAKTCDICCFNIWHPFDRPAYRDPLCLLDASSKPKGVERDGSPLGSVKYRTFTPTGVYALGPIYAPTDRWVFCSDMKPEEAWLFKNYDTRDNVAKCAFHNSFHDPFYEDKPEIPGRRSNEFTLLLTFPKEGHHPSSTPSRL